MSAFGEVKPHILSGDLIALGVTTNTPSPSLPDVPPIVTILPDWIEMATWHGIMGPAHLPNEIILKLNSATKIVMKDQEVQALIADLGGTVVAGSPEEFKQMVGKDIANIERLVKLANVEPQ
jgi:tripartite-type tricarboxylate transporter receptor subunit TctC